MKNETPKNVCVFCSANDVAEKYVKSTTKFGELIAQYGFNLVWGGSETGLMSVISNSVKNACGKIIGISVEMLQHKVHKNADEIVIAKTLGERKAMMLEKADAIVVLVGGIGTLDEITEILEFKKHGTHNKPIIVLNTDHFYEGFKTQMLKMKSEGFINAELDQLIYFAESPEQAIEYIENALQAQGV